MKFFNEQRVHGILFLSSLPQFLEVDYIRASVSVVKARLRMGYAGQTSLVYTLVPAESRTYRQKWQMAQSFIARLFYRVRIISKTSLYVARMGTFCQSHVRKSSRGTKIEEPMKLARMNFQ